MNIVALIPARAGSKRIPGKNIKMLGGKPLIQWTIKAAKESGVFRDIIVASDDYSLYELAHDAGVAWCLRETASDTQPDIEWVREVLPPWKHMPDTYTPDAFAILRPTSPFRTGDTIKRAWRQFQDTPCSSIRAVEPARQHPGKMWQLRYSYMEPLIGETWPPPFGDEGYRTRVPFHSQPTQSLPAIYVQNSSLEIAWTWCVTVFYSISGPKVAPFFTEGMEGFSIDYPEDWDRAERHLADLQAAAAGVK